jgi:Tfp pilus assembly protein PilN
MSLNSTFLPEDYVRRKRQTVTNVVCLALFAVVMFGTFIAFMVTTRRSTEVEQRKHAIDARYAQAAVQIDELRELQEQKQVMLDRAELAAALVERVPRSILLAELINRMPPDVSLMEFTIESEKVKQIIRTDLAQVAGGKKKPATGRLAPARAATRTEAAAAGELKVRPPRYLVDLTLVGVARTDRDVARFLTELNAFPLLSNVALDYSEEASFGDTILREFSIRMKLDPDADIRKVEEKPRTTASVAPEGTGPADLRGIFARPAKEDAR